MPPSLFTRRRFLTNAGMAAMALRGAPLYSATPSIPIKVSTPSGKLRGEQIPGVNIFRGVPFAQPPIGPLRFRAPVPIEAWAGDRDATRFAAEPVQIGEPGVQRSEDCLYLNIWAPARFNAHPVYVWIHGGGFTQGNAFESMYDGAGLAQQGIVCVTVEYRLGAFGFLDLEPLLGADYRGSANNALRDLIAALQWIQVNIAAFGGDPSNITVGGQSAGAKLTDILMGVPSAQPLFHQMISESGGAERVFTQRQSEDVAAGFGRTWTTISGSKPEALLTAPAETILEAQSNFIGTWPQHFPLRCQVGDSLLPRLPIESIASGSTRGKRLLIGTNRDESAWFFGAHPQKDPGAANLGNLQTGPFLETMKRYKNVYPQMADELIRIRALTAEEYWIPSMRVVDAHIKGGGSAWMYRMDFSESTGPLRGLAFHSLEIPLVWDRPHAQAGNAAAEAMLATQMNEAWVSFLYGGKPFGVGIPSWPVYDSGTRSTMVFDVRNRVEQRPQEAELRLWEGLL